MSEQSKKNIHQCDTCNAELAKLRAYKRKYEDALIEIRQVCEFVFAVPAASVYEEAVAVAIEVSTRALGEE